MDWIGVFDTLSTNAQLLPHQSSGWKDIETVEEWDEYVLDVIGDRLPPRCSVFEAGSGCLAFLQAVQRRHPQVEIAGMDASPECLERIQRDAACPAEAARFYLGRLPQDLQRVPDQQYDVAISNSVFQYLGGEEDATRTVEELLRITRPDGTVIVADVCDEAAREQNDENMRKLWPGYGTPEGLPAHTYFARSWWERFSSDRVEVEIRISGALPYWRRQYRYNVYLLKRQRART